MTQSANDTFTLASAPRTFRNVAGGVNGGDVGGTEVYVTDSGGSWVALVSIAEGEMGEPVLVPALVTRKNFEKTAFTAHENKITGTIGRTSMTLSQEETRFVLNPSATSRHFLVQCPLLVRIFVYR